MRKWLFSILCYTLATCLSLFTVIGLFTINEYDYLLTLEVFQMLAPILLLMLIGAINEPKNKGKEKENKDE